MLRFILGKLTEINHLDKKLKRKYENKEEQLDTQHIWIIEDEVIVKNLNTRQRLKYHQNSSQPIKERIKRWGEVHIANGTIEADSDLGKAIRYFIKHYQGLAGFCRIKGAQLDNNTMKGIIKLTVPDRKNAMS